MTTADFKGVMKSSRNVINTVLDDKKKKITVNAILDGMEKSFLELEKNLTTQFQEADEYIDKLEKEIRDANKKK